MSLLIALRATISKRTGMICVSRSIGAEIRRLRSEPSMSAMAMLRQLRAGSFGVANDSPSET
jgi:hypothetical protein